MKDARDAARQHATVDALLKRLFDGRSKRRREIQILADEVGMGKTFVALAVAYSVLGWMRRSSELGDLAGCYRKVLVITPPNAALFQKWQREVSEFVKRCVDPRFSEDAARSFAPSKADRFDELAYELRRTSSDRGVVVTDMAVFAGRKLLDYDLKRRVLLGQLFRLWSNGFPFADRDRLLKGAPWPGKAREFDVLYDEECERLKLQPEEIYTSLLRFQARGGSEWEDVQHALVVCKEIAAPYQRDREDQFAEIERILNRLYRAVCADSIRQSLPLVIVDEAHNWKNGPSQGANGFRDFTRYIACRTRRAVLLTATPFQLRPDEMLEVLKVSDYMKPAPTLAESEARQEELRRLREQTIRPVLDASASASIRFQKAWTRLPRTVTHEVLSAEWARPEIARARLALRELALEEGVSHPERIANIAKAAVLDVDPERREFMREALQLYCVNEDLSAELGALVIRHRRHTEHRVFFVGRETQRDFDIMQVVARPDRHVLHYAPGLDVRGEGELPHYLLMRCVSEMKQGHGRSSLGTALTGCYSTLLHSSEGKSVQRALGSSERGRAYLELLMSMVKPAHDPKHPKVEEVVEGVMRAWSAGEKSLIFCFRVNTAKRLRDIIDTRIRKELDARRASCLGGEEALRALRGRLTGRDRDLVTIGLDRVLWSFCWAESFRDEEPLFSANDLVLTDADARELARLALKYGVDLTSERVDRVFLHRATEHIVARRLLRDWPMDRQWHLLLASIAKPDESWITHPYGLDQGTSSGEAAGADDRLSFDERGVHTAYTARRPPNPEEIEALASEIVARRQRAARQKQISIFDTYALGPSLWFGRAPEVPGSDGDPGRRRAIASLHAHLSTLTWQEREFDWASRRRVLEAMRRTLLRESILVRLLPDSESEEEGLGVLLAEAVYAPLPGQRESMGDRLAVFLEDLASASGSVAAPDTARGGLIDATRLSDQRFVAMVEGGMTREDKSRVFTGFNTPLLPDVLVCTSVGQEGIDLHRHCRHVIHYDLAWNPAVLEQRTGRTDRIGSKTFRERDLRSPEEKQVHLEIGVPFLAGTYDERMYEELRVRAQTFEVLTGGDFAVENPEGSDDSEGASNGNGVAGIVPLPKEMVEDLRVKLNVWTETMTSPQ